MANNNYKPMPWLPYTNTSSPNYLMLPSTSYWKNSSTYGYATSPTATTIAVGSSLNGGRWGYRPNTTGQSSWASDEHKINENLFKYRSGSSDVPVPYLPYITTPCFGDGSSLAPYYHNGTPTTGSSLISASNCKRAIHPLKNVGDWVELRSDGYSYGTSSATTATVSKAIYCYLVEAVGPGGSGGSGGRNDALLGSNDRAAGGGGGGAGAYVRLCFSPLYGKGGKLKLWLANNDAGTRQVVKIQCLTSSGTAEGGTITLGYGNNGGNATGTGTSISVGSGGSGGTYSNSNTSGFVGESVYILYSSNGSKGGSGGLGSGKSSYVSGNSAWESGTLPCVVDSAGTNVSSVTIKGSAGYSLASGLPGPSSSDWNCSGGGGAGAASKIGGRGSTRASGSSTSTSPGLGAGGHGSTATNQNSSYVLANSGGPAGVIFYFREYETSSSGGGSLGGCVFPGTQISLDDYNSIDIEGFEGGTPVDFCNPDTLEHTPQQTLVKLFYKNATRKITIDLEDGKTVSLTPNHVILTKEGFKTYLDEDIYPKYTLEDEVATVRGYMKILSIQEEDVEPTTVYNLVTENSLMVANGIIIAGELNYTVDPTSSFTQEKNIK